MMTERIKINPDQVRGVAGQFKNAGAESEALINRLQQTVNGMAPDWEGLTKERFYNDFQQWQAAMRQFVQLLNGIGQQLNDIATHFEAVDKQT